MVPGDRAPGHPVEMFLEGKKNKQSKTTNNFGPFGLIFFLQVYSFLNEVEHEVTSLPGHNTTISLNHQNLE